MDLGRPMQALLYHHVVVVVQPDMAECQLEECPYCVSLASGDHEVVRFVLLEHQPHGLHVLAGMTPIAPGVQVAKRQLVGQAPLDLGDVRSDLACDKFEAAARALMIEQDATGSMKAIGFTVIARQFITGNFGNAIGGARMKRSVLVLRADSYATKHFARP